MKNKMLIFGDSYGDPRHNFGYIHENKLWYKLLEDRFDVLNCCIDATGPSYVIDYINKNLSLLKNIDKLIILFSDPYRFNFSFLKDPSHATTVKWIAENSCNFIKQKWKRKKFLSQDDKESREYLLEQEDVISNFYTKNDFFLKNYFNYFIKNLETKISLDKILIISIFNEIPNYKSVKIFPKKLYEVSQNEWVDENQYFYLHNSDQEYRKNHLSIENHKILYDNIINMIDGVDEYIPFKQKMLKTKNENEFIYE